jgi:hypothetical protein
LIVEMPHLIWVPGNLDAHLDMKEKRENFGCALHLKILPEHLEFMGVNLESVYIGALMEATYSARKRCHVVCDICEVAIQHAVLLTINVTSMVYHSLWLRTRHRRILTTCRVLTISSGYQPMRTVLRALSQDVVPLWHHGMGCDGISNIAMSKNKIKNTKLLFYVLSLHLIWMVDPDTALQEGQISDCKSGLRSCSWWHTRDAFFFYVLVGGCHLKYFSIIVFFFFFDTVLRILFC